MNLADQLRGYSNPAYSPGLGAPISSSSFGAPVSAAGAGSLVADVPQITAAVTPASSAGMGTVGTTQDGSGLGPMGVANMAIGGLQALGNMWLGFKAQKLANKQFDFQKKFAETDLVNSIQSYNTSLQDRHRSRASIEGRSEESGNQAYLAQKLKEYTPG